MKLIVTLRCGEKIYREVKESPLYNREKYSSEILGGTTRNNKGEYVEVIEVEYGDVKRTLSAA